MHRRSLFTAAFVLLLAVAAIAMAGSAGASANKAADDSDSAGIAPSGMVSAGAPKTVNLRTAPAVTTPGIPANAFINRPGIPMSQYLAAKAAAAGSTSQAPGKAAPQPLSTNTLQGHHELDGQCAAGEACYFPPDINGAVGQTEFATITNSHLSVWTKTPASPNLICRHTINSVLGYSGGDAFDPRIEYDMRWNRWVFSTDTFTDSSGNQRLFFGISLTNDACGSYYIYGLTLGSSSTNFVDYPQLGLSQDAVIFTYSLFSNSSGNQVATNTFGVAKAIVYNAQGFSVPIFTVAGSGTTTPPNVIDQNPRTHELLVQPGGSAYNIFLQNIANGAFASYQSATPISGVLTSVPPQAPQPGACSATSCLIDTSDARFVNDPTQYDVHLWAVNTVALGNFSAPHWYDIFSEGPSKNTVNQGNYEFMTNSSYDWNASIVALAGGRAMMTWSWDSPTGALTNPSMAMTGRLATDPAGTMNTPTNVFTSPSTLQGNYDPNFGTQRWGDTSSIRYDPGTARTFGFNETVVSGGNSWSSHEGVLSLS